MRTTITLPDDLYRRAKSQAARDGRTVSDLIADAVRQALRPRRQERADLPAMPVVSGSGLMPGVDLADTSSLLDQMDTGEPLDALR